MLRSMEPKVAASIPFHDEAKQLWDYLEKRFCMANGPRLQQLRADIIDCKQTKSMSIEDYYNRLMGLYDYLTRLKPLHACECGKCTCDVVGKFISDREEEKLHQFLIGVDDDSYAMVRTNLLSQHPPPDLDRAYQAFLQEERSRGIARGKAAKEEANVFAIQSDRWKGKFKRQDKSKLFCSHCKKSGHDDGTCFKIHGYPDWWEDRTRGGKGPGNNHTSATPQSNTGTTVSKHGKTGGLRVNAVTSHSGATSGTEAVGSNSGAEGASLADLTPEQVQILLNLVNNRQQDQTMGEYCSLSWIIDTGASRHVTSNASCLTHSKDILACHVGLPDGAQVVATKEGRVKLSGGITLEHVLFVPTLHCNLISVSKLTDDSKCFVRFTDSLCAIQDQRSGSLIGAGERKDGLYYYRGVPSVCMAKVLEISEFELWHRRMGHPSDRVVKLVPALRSSTARKSLNKACDVCPQAKQTRESFPNSNSKASRIFELIHCDLWGPYKTPSSGGARYFLTLVDDFSRAVWVYLLHSKTGVYKAFCSFFAMITQQFEVQVKLVRCDNGSEFNCMSQYFAEHGIIFQTSCVGTPQQNGRVERKHQHILNVGRALMFQGNLPISFWGECVLSAVYLINRTPSRLLENKTPYEILFGKEPSFSELRVFGSLCYAHNQKSKGDKFAPRSRKCVFVGYPHGKKGWKLYDLETGEIFVSRDVKLHENEFPFATTQQSHGIDTRDSEPINKEGMDAEFLDDLENILENNNGVGLETAQDTETTQQPAAAHDAGEVVEQPAAADVSSSPNLDATSMTTTDPISASTNETTEPVLGHGLRNKRGPAWHRDYVMHTVQKSSPSKHSSTSSSSSGTPYPIVHFVNCDKFSVRHRTFLAAVNQGLEPRTFHEAMKDHGWREAMQKEIEALEGNGTWKMEELPPGKKALGCKWVYKIKYHADGTIERLKARLVIFGNHQVEGIDYNETFAPVAKMVTVRAFLSVAAAKNLGTASNGRS